MNQEQLIENKYWIAKLAKEAMEEIPNLIGEDNSSKLSEVESRIAVIQEHIYGVKAPSVKSVVQEMYEITQAIFTQQTMGEPFNVEDLQGVFYMHIDLLANLLGIELEDK